MKVSIQILILMGILLLGCNAPREESESTTTTDKDLFPGLYSLHIMEQQDPETGEWNEWRDGMQGYILYDDLNTMSVHLTTKGYQDIDFQFPNFTDTISLEALKHLTNSYVYIAKYTVNEEEQYVQHARISHSNPADWNVVVQRRYEFSGDTLILRPMEETNSGLRLKWVRTEGYK